MFLGCVSQKLICVLLLNYKNIFVSNSLFLYVIVLIDIETRHLLSYAFFSHNGVVYLLSEGIELDGIRISTLNFHPNLSTLARF